MRNWNNLNAVQSGDRIKGFYFTYEELKLDMRFNLGPAGFRFYFTYEELKRW